MNKKRPIPEVVDAYKENYTTGCGCMKRDFYSSTTSGIGIFFFIHSFCHRFLFIHPQPLE
jgi:hypothetical protein